MVFLKKLFGKNKDKSLKAAPARSTKPIDSPVAQILAAKDADARLLLIQALEDEGLFDALLKENNREVTDQVKQVWLSRLAPQGAIPANADEATLTRIASLTNDADLSRAALEKISDEQTRFTLAKEHNVAKTRLAAASTLQSNSLLNELLAYAQGKDKAVYRYCKDKLAELQQVDDNRKALQDQIEYIRSTAQQLIRVGLGPEFVGKLQVIKKRWSELEVKIADFDADFDKTDIAGLIAEAEAILTTHRAEEERQASLKAEIASAKREQKDGINRIDALLTACTLEEPDSESLQASLLNEERDWADATSKHSATAEDQKHFDNAVKDITCVLTTLQFHQSIAAELATGMPDTEKAREWLQHLSWPNKVSTPIWLTEIKKIAGEKTADEKKVAAKVADKAQPKDDSAALAKAEALLVTLEAALDEGHASDAAQALKQLNKVTNDLNSSNANKINGPLRLLMNRLNELRDWQGFAVTPKKEALCEQMEALIGCEVTPDVLAERIKELQVEWKALGHSNDRDLWQRFQTASDNAFEPCKVYFAEQAELRGKLVEMRQTLIEELVRYEQEMDWENADWKVVQSTLNAARDTFNTYSPVDRNSHQRTQKDFRAICDAIYAHIKAEYDRNLEAKRALVEAAKEASTSEDINAAAELVKKLQQDWKSIGPTPRGPDQRLWQDLRKYADAVFARMSEERDARKSEIDEIVKQAEAIVKAAEDAVNNDDGMTQLKQARAEVDAMELPKGAQVRFSRTLGDLEKQIQTRKNAAVEAKAKGRWDTLQAALLNSGATSEVIPEQNSLPDNIDAAWFAQEKSADANAKELCIAMEILADIESPESDQQARMTVQVKRLAEGLGKGRSVDEERTELVKQWLTAEADKSLAERFVKALTVTI